MEWAEWVEICLHDADLKCKFEDFRVFCKVSLATFVFNIVKFCLGIRRGGRGGGGFDMDGGYNQAFPPLGGGGGMGNR